MLLLRACAGFVPSTDYSSAPGTLGPSAPANTQTPPREQPTLHHCMASTMPGLQARLTAACSTGPRAGSNCLALMGHAQR